MRVAAAALALLALAGCGGSSPGSTPTASATPAATASAGAAAVDCPAGTLLALRAPGLGSAAGCGNSPVVCSGLGDTVQVIGSVALGGTTAIFKAFILKFTGPGDYDTSTPVNSVTLSTDFEPTHLLKSQSGSIHVSSGPPGLAGTADAELKSSTASTHVAATFTCSKFDKL